MFVLNKINFHKIKYWKKLLNFCFYYISILFHFIFPWCHCSSFPVPNTNISPDIQILSVKKPKPLIVLPIIPRLHILACYAAPRRAAPPPTASTKDPSNHPCTRRRRPPVPRKSVTTHKIYNFRWNFPLGFVDFPTGFECISLLLWTSTDDGGIIIISLTIFDILGRFFSVTRIMYAYLM